MVSQDSAGGSNHVLVGGSESCDDIFFLIFSKIDNPFENLSCRVHRIRWFLRKLDLHGFTGFGPRRIMFRTPCRNMFRISPLRILRTYFFQNSFPPQTGRAKSPISKKRRVKKECFFLVPLDASTFREPFEAILNEVVFGAFGWPLVYVEQCRLLSACGALSCNPEILVFDQQQTLNPSRQRCRCPLPSLLWYSSN